MRYVIVSLILAACAPAHACDLTLGPGAVVRYGEGQTGGMASLGCIFDTRYGQFEVRGYWIGEQRIYDDSLRIKAFPAISFSKLWTFREGKRFQPVLGFGILLKGAQRCHYNGDTDCNRIMPLPFGFLPTVGLRYKDSLLFTLGHASNDSLDWGPEKKNLGFDHFRAEVIQVF